MGSADIDTRALGFGAGWIILDCGFLYTLFASFALILILLSSKKMIHSINWSKRTRLSSGVNSKRGADAVLCIAGQRS